MIMMMINTINHYNHHDSYNNDDDLQTTMVIIVAMPSLMVTMIKETSIVGANNSTPIIQEQVTMT